MSSKERAIGWLMPLALLLAACGQSTPVGSSGASTSPVAVGKVLSGSYDVGYCDGGCDAKAGRADVTSDGSRYRIEVTGLGQYRGYHQLFVFDGRRLLALDPDVSDRPIVYEVPHAYPWVLSFGAGFVYDAQMEPWKHWCGHSPPNLTARSVIMGRTAMGYACSSKGRGPMVWFDAATGLLLQTAGKPSVHHVTVNPTVTSDGFSTKPPSGMSASTAPARSQ